eukprot:1324364-Rhodomonas_salina.2
MLVSLQQQRAGVNKFGYPGTRVPGYPVNMMVFWGRLVEGCDQGSSHAWYKWCRLCGLSLAPVHSEADALYCSPKLEYRRGKSAAQRWYSPSHPGTRVCIPGVPGYLRYPGTRVLGFLTRPEPGYPGYPRTPGTSGDTKKAPLGTYAQLHYFMEIYN